MNEKTKPNFDKVRKLNEAIWKAIKEIFPDEFKLLVPCNDNIARAIGDINKCIMNSREDDFRMEIARRNAQIREFRISTKNKKKE